MAGLEFLRQELDELERAGLRRTLRTVDGPQGSKVRLDGDLVLNFCSNNYLGLAHEPTLGNAAASAAVETGTGSGASRLIGGTLRGHSELEGALAKLAHAAAALSFNSGYHANVGVLPALVGDGDVVFSDELPPQPRQYRRLSSRRSRRSRDEASCHVRRLSPPPDRQRSGVFDGRRPRSSLGSR
jgi:7-keto-8-aminopelargonate synthetase-like enzyme